MLLHASIQGSGLQVKPFVFPAVSVLPIFKIDTKVVDLSKCSLI